MYEVRRVRGETRLKTRDYPRVGRSSLNSGEFSKEIEFSLVEQRQRRSKSDFEPYFTSTPTWLAGTVDQPIRSGTAR